MKSFIENVNTFIVQVIENFFVHEYEDIEDEDIQSTIYNHEEMLNKD